MTDISPPTKEEARSFSQFLLMLEDGGLNADLSEVLRDLNAHMNNHIMNYGGTPKGSITLKIDFALVKGVFDIKAKYSVTKPEADRPRSIAWSTPGNNFSPDNPRQMTLFPKAVRDVTSQDAADVRTVTA